MASTVLLCATDDANMCACQLLFDLPCLHFFQSPGSVLGMGGAQASTGTFRPRISRLEENCWHNSQGLMRFKVRQAATEMWSTL